MSVCRSYPTRVSRPSTAAATSGSMVNLLPGAVFLEKLDDERLKPANPGSAKRWSAALDTPHPFASNRSRASSYVSSRRGRALMVSLGGRGEPRKPKGGRSGGARSGYAYEAAISGPHGRRARGVLSLDPSP